MTGIAQACSFLEGLRWRDGRFWASDVFHRRIVASEPDGPMATVAVLKEEPSGLGWLPDGTLLVVSVERHRLLRVAGNGAIAVHADLAGLASGHPNDMVVDATGRAFVGISGFDLSQGEAVRPGAIVRVDPDGVARIVADDLLYPNGMVVLADGVTLVVAESFGQRLTAFTLDAGGNLTNRRTWASFGPPCMGGVAPFVASGAVMPDGIAADADDRIWVADAFAGRAIRVRKGGVILDTCPAPEGFGVYACMLGGADGRTLALCANAHLDRAAALASPTARLVMVRATAAHAGHP